MNCGAEAPSWFCIISPFSNASLVAAGFVARLVRLERLASMPVSQTCVKRSDWLNSDARQRSQVGRSPSGSIWPITQILAPQSPFMYSGISQLPGTALVSLSQYPSVVFLSILCVVISLLAPTDGPGSHLHSERWPSPGSRLHRAS